MDYRDLSFWHDSLPGDIIVRPALTGDADADVAIVGAGFTGLWTAYYLTQVAPSLRVVVIEKETAGFGASGRNGGWCVGEVASPLPMLEKAAGRDAAIATVRAIHATVDEVGAATAREGIDCHFAKGGVVYMATNRVQLARLERRLAEVRGYGFGEEDYRRLSIRETAAIVNVAGLHGGLFATHAAAIHPARLARGLADVVERAGVRLYDGTTVTAIERGGVVTDRGRVRADVVVRATEGYTPELAGFERVIVPAQNFMIATEPLSASTWDEIGMADRPCFEDGRYLLFYGQRTADDRIAIGGLTVPYAWQSGVPASPMPAMRVHDRLHKLLGQLFPMLTDVKVTHRWGGVLGIPRDWFPSVGFDRERGYAWGGGYVGEGVAAANLAGRTLADLISGRDTDLVKLPWVNHTSPDWEPEPFRWVGLRGVAGVLGVVDRIEARTGRHQKWAEGLLGDGGR